MGLHDIISFFWSFVREDTDMSSFKRWIEDNIAELRGVIPDFLFLSIVAFDFKTSNKTEINNLKAQLRRWLEAVFIPTCFCITWRDGQILNIGELEGSDRVVKKDYFDCHFHIKIKRTPWLKLIKCVSCATYWYLALDRFYDYFILKRLSKQEINTILRKNQWPTYFDKNSHFWPSAAWFEHYGYQNIKEWQEKNNKR